MLTIMSGLAQEESRSISENAKWGIRNSFANGKVVMPCGAFLGCRKGEDGQPEIIPEEADVTGTICRRFLCGLTPHPIARSLTEAGIPTPKGMKVRSDSTIQPILQNERYKGDAILQKSFCTDFLSKKDGGEVPRYYGKNSQERCPCANTMKPYPAALKDCFAVPAYIDAHKAQPGVEQIAVGGENAGGAAGKCGIP